MVIGELVWIRITSVPRSKCARLIFWDEYFGMNLSCRAGRLIVPGNKYIRPAAEAGADYIN